MAGDVLWTAGRELRLVPSSLVEGASRVNRDGCSSHPRREAPGSSSINTSSPRQRQEVAQPLVGDLLMAIKGPESWSWRKVRHNRTTMVEFIDAFARLVKTG